MGGGRGSRLYPLTRHRSKPAVPLAAMFRLVDIPISNCLNSGLNQIYLLTQFNTESLHRHIRESYRFDVFGGGFVEILAAEQTQEGTHWYQGTADAVRQNLRHIRADDDDLVIILSGDQLYNMNYRRIIDEHVDTGASVTVSATPIDRSLAHAFGLMKVGEDRRIQSFVEKPQDEGIIDELILPPELSTVPNSVLVSMGIYVFDGKTLRTALDSQATDFGKEVIPGLLDGGQLFAHVFEGYWEDIGTVKAFFDANLRLTDDQPPFNFYNPEHPIYTRTRFLPAAKINHCNMTRSIVAGGSIISADTVERCVIGVRSHIREGTVMKNSIMMGSEQFESEEQQREAEQKGLPALGVGKNCRIEGTILDANVRIGDNVVLSPEGKPDGYEKGDAFVCDGVLVISKGGVIPANYVF